VIDALGQPQSVLVLGGTSDLAVATLELMVGRRLHSAVLAGRDPSSLEVAAGALTAAGCPKVATAAFDANDSASHDQVVPKLFVEHGGFDVVLIAFGVLGDQDEAERDGLAAQRIATTNYVGVVTSGLAVARSLREQGHGAIVLLSSVAGERVRRANFVYGSSKAGADAFAQGLGDSLHGSGVRVLIVRPGFVRSKMTEGMPPAPMAVDPDDVAAAIVRGLERRAQIVWVPAKLRAVFFVLRHLPRSIFRRLPS